MGKNPIFAIFHQTPYFTLFGITSIANSKTNLATPFNINPPINRWWKLWGFDPHFAENNTLFKFFEIKKKSNLINFFNFKFKFWNSKYRYYMDLHRGLLAWTRWGGLGWFPPHLDSTTSAGGDTAVTAERVRVRASLAKFRKYNPPVFEGETTDPWVVEKGTNKMGKLFEDLMMEESEHVPLAVYFL